MRLLHQRWRVPRGQNRLRMFCQGFAVMICLEGEDIKLTRAVLQCIKVHCVRWYFLTRIRSDSAQELRLKGARER